MMNELRERLKAIKEQIERLQNSNKQLREEASGREKEISRLKQLVEIQNNSLKELEQKLKIKRIAEGVNQAEETEGSNRDLKFKINEMIKEVDKIMNLMHQ